MFHKRFLLVRRLFSVILFFWLALRHFAASFLNLQVGKPLRLTYDQA